MKLILSEPSESIKNPSEQNTPYATAYENKELNKIDKDVERMSNEESELILEYSVERTGASEARCALIFIMLFASSLNRTGIQEPLFHFTPSFHLVPIYSPILFVCHDYPGTLQQLPFSLMNIFGVHFFPNNIFKNSIIHSLFLFSPISRDFE